MPKLMWDQTGERRFETGVDRGALYPYDSKQKKYGPGVAWQGLVNVNIQPSGGEATPLYADNITYLNLVSAEKCGFTIEAYTYPDEFAECDGSATVMKDDTDLGISIAQQSRKPFGFSYRTRIGNDVDGDSAGFMIHMLWGALAKPSEKAYATVNDTPDAITFSWEATTTPVAFADDGEYKDLKPTAYMTVDSTKISAEGMTALTNKLWGDSPELPLPEDVIKLIKEAVTE